MAEPVSCHHCGRTVALLENGEVCIICHRCKTERHISISDLIASLEASLVTLREMASVVERHSSVTPVLASRRPPEAHPPKPFG